MGYVSWDELQQRQLVASTQISVGSLWPEETMSADAHEVIGHCIIEASDEIGVVHRAIEYPTLAFISPLTPRPDKPHAADIDLDELALQCRLASLKVSTGSIWEHSKTHGTYQVLGRCVLNGQTIPETGILYSAVSQPRSTFTRPLSSWLSLVDIDGQPVMRFQELV